MFVVQYGININPSHPAGQPASPGVIPGAKWTRFVFKVDALSRSLEQAFAFYDPLIALYKEAGIRSLVVLNQETFWGNGPWDNGDWSAYAISFAAVCGKVAARYKGQQMAYEIWNEGDIRGASSVFVPANEFARVLTMVSREIRANDPGATIVFGGLAEAPGNAVSYVRQVRSALGGSLPVDAIGVHPYGQWSPNFAQKPTWGGWFGKLEDYLTMFTTAFPNIPLWMTEVGISEAVPFPLAQYPLITAYMQGVFDLIRQRFLTNVPVVVWFAWSDALRNAGLADGSNNPKGPILEKFLEVVRAANALEKEAPAEPITPYDGMIGVVHTDGRRVRERTIDELIASLRAQAPQVGAIWIKTNDGDSWQGTFDTSGKADLRVSGVADVARWAQKCADAGLELHCWSVVRGLNPDAEIALMAEVCNVPGVKSFILDVEVGRAYFQGGPQVAAKMAEGLRLRIPDGFHLALCLDARGSHPRDIHIARWLPSMDSLHPMTYHRLFEIEPEEAVRNALRALEPYGLPVVPMLQAYDLGDPDEIRRAGETVFNSVERIKPLGISLYVLGNITAEAFAASQQIKVPNPKKQKRPVDPRVFDFTNQQLINAFAAAAEAVGEAQNFWTWVVSANLEWLASDRTRLYSGAPIDELPGLSAEQKSLVRRALAGEKLERQDEPPDDSDLLGRVTHQQVINAFFEAAHTLGEKDLYWQRVTEAGIPFIADNRKAFYTGPAISTLPNLAPAFKLAVINSLRAALPLPGGGIRLDVPWVSQIDVNSPEGDDCGQACVLMLLKYYAIAPADLTVAKLTRKLLGKTNGAQLRWLAAQYGLNNLTVDTGFVNADSMCPILDKRRPVILLVNYKDLLLPDHLATGSDQGWHWVTIVGYDADHFLMHDPLWTPAQNGGKGGANLELARSTLNGAMVRLGGRYLAVY